MSEFGVQRVRIRLTEPLDDEEFSSRFDELDVEPDGRVLDLSFREATDGPSPVDDVLRALYDAGHQIESLQARSSSLEEIFKELVYVDDEESE